MTDNIDILTHNAFGAFPEKVRGFLDTATMPSDVSLTVKALAGMGVRVHCLALGGVDLTSSAGTMTMNVLNAVAQFERDLLIERTQSGLNRAKAEGKTLGRPATLSERQKQAVRDELAAGVSVSALARKLGTSRQTVMRARAADS